MGLPPLPADRLAPRRAFGEAGRASAGYVDVDYKKMRGTFVRTPEFAEVPYPVQIEPSLVIEYYSKH